MFILEIINLSAQRAIMSMKYRTQGHNVGLPLKANNELRAQTLFLLGISLI